MSRCRIWRTVCRGGAEQSTGVCVLRHPRASIAWGQHTVQDRHAHTRGEPEWGGHLAEELNDMVAKQRSSTIVGGHT